MRQAFRRRLKIVRQLRFEVWRYLYWQQNDMHGREWGRERFGILGKNYCRCVR